MDGCRLLLIIMMLLRAQISSHALTLAGTKYHLHTYTCGLRSQQLTAVATTKYVVLLVKREPNLVVSANWPILRTAITCTEPVPNLHSTK